MENKIIDAKNIEITKEFKEILNKDFLIQEKARLEIRLNEISLQLELFK